MIWNSQTSILRFFCCSQCKPLTYKEAIQSRNGRVNIFTGKIKNLAISSFTTKSDDQWVYKIKQKPDGNINRFNARLCAQGFSQKYGSDYVKTDGQLADMFTESLQHST